MLLTLDWWHKKHSTKKVPPRDWGWADGQSAAQRQNKIMRSLILDSIRITLLPRSWRNFGGTFVIRFIRSSVWPTVWAKKLVSIDGKLLEDSNRPKIVKIGAIQSQFGPFFENSKFGKNEHWYYGTLVLETKIRFPFGRNLVETLANIQRKVWRNVLQNF